MSHSTVPRGSAEASTPATTTARSGGATGSAGSTGTTGSTGSAGSSRGRGAGRASLRHRFRRDRVLILMTLPAVVLVLVFNYLPILGNVVAFQDYDPYVSDNGVVSILNSPFVGLDNFHRMFEDPAFWNAVQNTLVLFSVQLLLFFPVPILVALLINSVVRPRVRAVAQAVLYLPHFFSWVLVIAVFQQMFGGAGMLSQLLRRNGYDGLDIMTNPDTFPFLLTAQSVWKDAGWGIIVFLAALASVPTDLYEAAAMDGAGRWRRMWHVTLPALRPVIALLLVLRVGDALTVGFEQILLQRDAVGTDAGEVLDTFVWWNGVRNQDFGYAAAAGLVKGVVSIGLVLAANKVAHLMGEQGVYKK
ncbi:ABC transporter permease subunit [Streptomyces longwoodensis]|uniref:ABC transporter permease n=1 Tax=Streptomyces longwoodensis TaxID=68231 RepID=UPI002DD99C72|nr:ABC transporter permease subunit [Streptomyces longwoodensis]WRY90948.1 ABC transporter permease subunit [Streptomyces longwoodensis]WTI44761.1 ABC transporter permease subunit [Streptomyces longwoodensis]WUC57558.1 ABC transporter permease subunit [Streptomyces longwoodensis]